MQDVLPDGRLHYRAVEHSVVEHCNLTCDGCDHGSPLLRKKFANPRDFARSVSQLARVMFVDRLKLLGGEPLLHPEIGEFARIARESGIAREVQIWSNGTSLDRINYSIFAYVDRLVISRYPSVAIPVGEEDLRSKLEPYKCALAVREIAEFIRCYPLAPHQDNQQIAEIFRSCKNTGEWSCHSFQDGYYFKCSRAHFLRYRAFGDGQGNDVYKDGVRLDDPDLRRTLASYLASTVPLGACAWCLGTSGESYPHRLSPRQPARSLRELALRH